MNLPYVDPVAPEDQSLAGHRGQHDFAASRFRFLVLVFQPAKFFFTKKVEEPPVQLLF